MIQKYAFTTVAMAAALGDTPVSYDDLAEIEKEFDDVEIEIIRQQVSLTRSLYERRHKIVSQIPNFWPLVLEQAPPDIDQYIQPSDSALLLSSLTSISVRHFELEESGGDPRSVLIRWEFAKNVYFEDIVLEKRFWHRRSRDGWSGLVSEPVHIRWCKGKDLTGGLLDLVCNAWESEKASREKNDKMGLTDQQIVLKKKIDQTGMGGLSFFAWFGFIGRRISAEESAGAIANEAQRREARRSGKAAGSLPVEEDYNEAEDLALNLEIFPDGDDLAVAITEDLWPGAIKYFTQAQEQDALSDADFESDDDEDLYALEDDEDLHALKVDEGSDRPTKKRKA